MSIHLSFVAVILKWNTFSVLWTEYRIENTIKSLKNRYFGPSRIRDHLWFRISINITPEGEKSGQLEKIFA